MRKWLLIVDDEVDLRDMVRTHVELNYGDDIRIVEAKDGLEATTKLRFQAFNCIVTDLNMPRKDGWQFIHDCRRNAFNENTPIVIVSGALDQQPIEESHVSTLKKPFKGADLISILDKQFKLGRTDHRVAADLLNTFIDATFEFFRRGLNLEAEQRDPIPKRAGESIEKGQHQIVRLRIGKLKSRFLFSYDEPLLDKMSAIQDISKDKLLKASSQAIVNFSIKKLNDSVAVDSNDLATAEVIKNVENNPGIHIPIGTEHGDVRILAIWERPKS